MLTSDLAQNKKLSDQIRISVTQGILQVLGPENIIKIIAGDVEVDRLNPIGNRIGVRLQIDVYPRTTGSDQGS